MVAKKTKKQKQKQKNSALIMIYKGVLVSTNYYVCNSNWHLVAPH